ncbi:MAG: PqqD family peptide modification chaperone [Pseudomonadota bacterium]
MSSSQVYVTTDSFCTTNLDDRLVALVIENGKYYSFGHTGKAILQLLEHPMTLDQLVEKLSASYHVTKETCLTESAQFLVSLEHAGLIKKLPA